MHVLLMLSEASSAHLEVCAATDKEAAGQAA
jgi:hypothetical protein